MNEPKKPETPAQEGAKRLRLSVQRMKKLRTEIKAGPHDHADSVTWHKPWG